jgi:hypothetical protein
VTLSGERFGGLAGCAAAAPAHAAPAQTTAARTVHTASLGALALRTKNWPTWIFPFLAMAKTPSAKATIVERYLMMPFKIKHQLNFRITHSGTKRWNHRRRAGDAHYRRGGLGDVLRRAGMRVPRLRHPVARPGRVCSRHGRRHGSLSAKAQDGMQESRRARQPAVVMPKWSGIGQNVGTIQPSRFCVMTQDLAHDLGSIVHDAGQVRDADA